MSEEESEVLLSVSRVSLNLAVVWGVLFSLNGLSSCIIAVLVGSKWAEIDLQTVARLSAGKLPPMNGGTDTDRFRKGPGGVVTKE